MKGEVNFEKGTDGNWQVGNLYGVNDEIAAYKAQYGYDGKIDYRIYGNSDEKSVLLVLSLGKTPAQMNSALRKTIDGMNQINAKFVNSMADGVWPAQDIVYPMQFTNPGQWNKN